MRPTRSYPSASPIELSPERRRRQTRPAQATLTLDSRPAPSFHRAPFGAVDHPLSVTDAPRGRARYGTPSPVSSDVVRPRPLRCAGSRAAVPVPATRRSGHWRPRPSRRSRGNGTTTSVFSHPHERGPSLLPNPDRTRPRGQGGNSLGGAKSCATAVTKVAHVCGIEPRPFPVSGFQYSAREEEAADRQLAS